MTYLIQFENNGSVISIDTRTRKEKNMIAVLQLDSEGNVINEFPSIMSAQRATGIYNISECIAKIRKTAGGYVWQSIKGE